jgi:Undecaprenyl-phosphate glucose phosphotransferase
LYQIEATAMKLNSDDIRQATVVDIAQFAGSNDRAGLRTTVKASLAQSVFVAPRLVAAAIRIIEALLILIVAMGCAVRYPGIEDTESFNVYFLVSALVAIAMPLFLELAGLYKLDALLMPMQQSTKIISVWTAVFSALTIAVFFLKAGASLSRLWLLMWAFAGLFFFLAARYFVAHALRRVNQTGQFNRRAIIVGGGEAADKVIAALQGSPNSGFSLIGMFDDRDDQRALPELRGLHKLGNVDDLIDFARATRVDTLIITLPVTAEDRLLQILNRLWVLPVDIRLSAYGQKVRYRPRAYSYIGNLPCLDVFDRPLGDWGPILKSAQDRIIACLAIVALAPVLAVVALAVKLESKGPFIFKQKRFGFNNDLIEIYKFRSMYTDRADNEASKLVTKNDPRVTRVGRFIRRTSLDELPQLFNVLKGDLSLVGPRPHATKAKAGEELYEHVVDGYFARHRVKPGITGWAQINGWRGETDTAEKIERRVEHDLFYIENWSLTFDLYILARTPIALLNTDHAY